jgi:hypothetical protein
MTTAVPVEGATTTTKSRAVAEATAVAVAAETSPAAVATETDRAEAAESCLPASYEPGAATSLHLEETSQGGCNRGQVSCHFYLMFFPFFFSGDFFPVIALLVESSVADNVLELNLD